MAWVVHATCKTSSINGMKLFRSPPTMEILSIYCLMSWSSDSSLSSLLFDPRLHVWSNPYCTNCNFSLSLLLLFLPQICRNDLGADWSHISCLLIYIKKVTKTNGRPPPHIQRRKIWQGPSHSGRLGGIIRRLPSATLFSLWVWAHIIWAVTLRRPCVCDFFFPFDGALCGCWRKQAYHRERERSM